MAIFNKLIVSTMPLLVFMACGTGDQSDDRSTSTTLPAATISPTVSNTHIGNLVKIVNKDQGGSGEYGFYPSEFSFKVGETVTFELAAETEFHTFTIDELDIDESVESRQTKTFTVTFTEGGEFQLYCIPHEAFGMVGKIIVD